MKKTNKKGFTLVELLVVIAIIAILSVVSIVGYTSFTKRAKQSNATTELAQVTTFLYAETANVEARLEIKDGYIIVPIEEVTIDANATTDETSALEKAKAVITAVLGTDAAAFASKVGFVDPVYVGDKETNAEKYVAVKALKLSYNYDDGAAVAEWTVATNSIEAK